MNAGLLSFLAAVYGVAHRLARHADQGVRTKRERMLPWISGMLFGVTGVLTMLAPLRLSEGVIVDARLVVAGLAAAYLPAAGALLCAAVMAVYRIAVGGVGTGPAMVGIVLCTGIGWAWQRYRPVVSAGRGTALADGLWLIGLGLSLAAGGMLAIQTLPPPIASMVTERTWAAVLLVYPIGACLLGYLLDNVHRLHLREDALERTAGQLQGLLAEARLAGSVFINSKDAIAIL